MADTTISGLSAAVAAVRTMEVPVNKGGGENAKVTLEQIINLVSDTLSNAVSIATAGANSVTSAEYASLVDRVSANSGTGGGGSVTSAEVQTASAAATSVDARVNALSQIVSVLSNVVSNELSVRAASIQTLSNAVTSVDTRVNTVSNIVSQNIVSIAAISNQLSGLTVINNAGTSVKGMQSALNALSNRIYIVSNAASDALSHAAAASAAATSVDARVNTVSDLVSKLTSAFNAVSNLVSANNNASMLNTANASVRGLQSVFNAFSNRISAINTGAGLTSTQVSDMVGSIANNLYSIRAFSASGSSNTSVKGFQSILNRISNTFSNAFSAGSVLSANVTSLQNAHASVIAASARNSANTSIKGTQSIINVLSARIVDASAAATSVDARLNTVSNQVSVLSAGMGLPQLRIVTGAQVISAASFTNVSGMSLSVTSAATYQIEGQVLWTTSIQTGTAFGFTYPAGITTGGMTMEGPLSVMNGGTLTSANYGCGFINQAGMSTTATTNFSALGTSATTLAMAIWGTVRLGANAGTIQLQAKQSATGGGVQILADSWLRAYRIR